MGAVGSFLTPGLEQFGGMRPQRLAWPLNGKIMGHGHVGVGRGVGLRFDFGSETWEEESVSVGGCISALRCEVEKVL